MDFCVEKQVFHKPATTGGVAYSRPGSFPIVRESSNPLCNLKIGKKSSIFVKIVAKSIVLSKILLLNNRTQDKTVAEFRKTVAATAPFLMPILVLLVLVPLFRSVTDTTGTKIGIKNGAVATTVFQNSATVLSLVLLNRENHIKMLTIRIKFIIYHKTFASLGLLADELLIALRRDNRDASSRTFVSRPEFKKNDLNENQTSCM